MKGQLEAHPGATPLEARPSQPVTRLRVRGAAHPSGIRGWCSACKKTCRKGVIVHATIATEPFVFYCSSCARRIGKAIGA